MGHLLNHIGDWLTPTHLQGVLGVSACMAIASLLLTPYLIVRLPPDYFLKEQPHFWLLYKTATSGRRMLLVLKNLLGVVLLILGFIMLFLPGQGLLTILVGLIVTDFPRKRVLLRHVVEIKSVARSLNWLRARHGKPPLYL